MVLDKLSSSLRETLNKIAKAVFVDERLINELIKDIQRALLQADVNVQLVFDLTKKIKERAKQEPKGLTKREYLINIVYEELTNFLGKEKSEIKIDKKQFKIMMIGLFGSGKTTTIGKLAFYYSKRGYKVCSIGLDVHRPAAPEQLEQVSRQANIQCFIDMSEKRSISEHDQKSKISDEKEKNPLNIYNRFKDELKKYDIILIDTSGRDALSKDLINEIELLNKEIKPDERILVISGDIGQAAQKQAEQFHSSCNITGVIATKLDGTAKAGGALTACAVTSAPIKFIGTGEKIDDIEQFNPSGFVSRLLGMGDLEALLEKAKTAIKEEEAEDLGKRFLKGEFNLLDLYEHMEAMSKMGPLGKIVEMIPGFSQLKLPKDMLKIQEDKLKKWKYAMNSMTKQELEEPEIIDRKRIERISKGSGIPTSEIRELIKHYKQSKKLMKAVKGEKGMEKMMQRLQKGNIKLK